MALQKNIGAGHTAAHSALVLMGGQPWQGALKDKGIIYRFEHATAIVQRLVCQENEAARDVVTSEALVLDGDPPAAEAEFPYYAVDTIGYAGDCTNSNAIERDKINMASLNWSTISRRDIRNIDVNILDDADLPMMDSNAFADIYKVLEGTAEELYATILKHFKSAFLKTWLDRKNNLVAGFANHVLSHFCMAVDKGGDNVGVIRRIVKDVETTLMIMIWTIFCFFHQFHLIVEKMVKILDNWDWDSDSDDECEPNPETAKLPVKYFNCMKIVCNTMRFSGNRRKLSEKAEQLFGDAVARDIGGKAMPAPVKGRWGQAQTVQLRLCTLLTYLYAVVKDLWTQDAANIVSEAAAHDDEQQRFSRWRGLTVKICRNKLFHTMVQIASVCMEPISHALWWGEKASKEETTARKEAKGKGTATIQLLTIVGPKTAIVYVTYIYIYICYK